MADKKKTKRSAAAKKAWETRKKNEKKRKEAAKKAVATRKKNKRKKSTPLNYTGEKDPLKNREKRPVPPRTQKPYTPKEVTPQRKLSLWDKVKAFFSDLFS